MHRYPISIVEGMTSGPSLRQQENRKAGSNRPESPAPHYLRAGRIMILESAVHVAARQTIAVAEVSTGRRLP